MRSFFNECCLGNFVQIRETAKRFVEFYCNKLDHSQKHTRLYLYVCLTSCMHILCTHTVHNNETLELLTWIMGGPSHCNKDTLKCSHVLDCAISRWVNIRHPSRSLTFIFLTLPLATVLILMSTHKFGIMMLTKLNKEFSAEWCSTASFLVGKKSMVKSSKNWHGIKSNITKLS